MARSSQVGVTRPSGARFEAGLGQRRHREERLAAPLTVGERDPVRAQSVGRPLSANRESAGVPAGQRRSARSGPRSSPGALAACPTRLPAAPGRRHGGGATGPGAGPSRPSTDTRAGQVRDRTDGMREGRTHGVAVAPAWYGCRRGGFPTRTIRPVRHSAVGKSPKRLAKLHSPGAELTRPSRESTATDPLEVVERCRTFDIEAFVETEGDLRRDVPHRTSHRRHDDRRQDRHGLGPCHDQHRTPHALDLCPPDIALCGERHQGSSAIKARVASSRPTSSTSVCGCSR